MAVYIRLFHGRKTPDEQLDDWGSDGPVLGPFDFVHTTYAHHVKLGAPGGCDEMQDLQGVEDLLYYDGVWYGDWSVFGCAALAEDGFTPEPYDPEKAQLPKIERKPIRAEFYVLWDDGTWSTETVSYIGPETREAMVFWFEHNMLSGSAFRSAVAVQLGAYGGEL